MQIDRNVITTALVMIFPDIALWLPAQMKKG